MALLTEADWARIFEEWDGLHPADAEERETSEEVEEVSDEEFEATPRIPTLDEMPAVVDYSVRGPGDFIVSGPIRGGVGRGVVFDSELKAYQAMCIRYGSKRVIRWDPGLEGRWAFLIKRV